MSAHLRALVGKIAVALTTSLLLAGCTALPGGAELTSAPAEPLTIRGLADGPGDAPNHRYIFHTHGMGKTEDTFGEELFPWLAEAGYRPVPAESSTDWTDARLDKDGKAFAVSGELLTCRDSVEKPCRYADFGRYRIDVFRRNEDVIKVYTYYWHEDLWLLQNLYLKADLQQGGRAAVNGWLKKDVVDEGFSDATAYLGGAGALVRGGMESALCQMVADAGGVRPQTYDAFGEGCLDKIPDVVIPDGVEFSYVSHSLGSRMLWDVLSGYGAASARGDSARGTLARRASTFYMAANQLPLLGLGRLKVDPAADAASLAYDPCQNQTSFLRFRCGSPPGLIDQDLDIVAFHDPDDLLGFDAGDIRSESTEAHARFFDVRHRNTPQWLWLLAWPSSAHDQELKRSSSAKLIVCGAEANPGQPALKPLNCQPH